MLLNNLIYGQGSHCAITKMQINSSGQLIFQTSKEVNVKLFILLGGQNQSEEFEVIDRIPSKGNNMIPQTYRHNLKSISHKYYYITAVTMDGSSFSSKVFSSKKALIIPEDFMPSNSLVTKNP